MGLVVAVFSIIGVIFFLLGSEFSSSEMKENNEAIVKLVFMAIAAYFLSSVLFVLLAMGRQWLAGIYLGLTLLAVIYSFIFFIDALKNR